MKAMYKYLLLFICFSFGAFAQEEKGWMEYGSSDEDSTSQDTIQHYGREQSDTLASAQLKDTLSISFNGPDKKSSISQSKMIDELIELMGTPTSPDGVLLKGYRIQIHFGQDKNDANQERANFLARYDDVPVYLDYQAPNFRVRVGDFRNRLEAEKFKSELLAEYPGLIIVHDKIKLPPIPEKEELEMKEE